MKGIKMDSLSNSTTVPIVSIAGIEIDRDEAGRYNLNSIHRASKLGDEKAPSKWTRNKATVELVAQLEKETGQICLVSNEGRTGGTFVDELLAVSYAGWISAAFQLTVNRAFVEARSPRVSLPDFSNPAVAARAWADQVEARVTAERTKAEIGSRREATAMNKASQAVKKANMLEMELDRSRQYASVKRMERHFKTDFAWRPLKTHSLLVGLKIISAFDANYGKVNAYHADAWLSVYSVEIPSAIAVEDSE